MMNSFPPQKIVTKDQRLDLVYLLNPNSEPKPIIPKIADLTEKKSDKCKSIKSSAIIKTISSSELDDLTKKNLMGKYLELCGKPTNSNRIGRRKDWELLSNAARELQIDKDNVEKIMNKYTRTDRHAKQLNPQEKVMEQLIKNRILNALDEKSSEKIYKSNEAAWEGLTSSFDLSQEKLVKGKELCKTIDKLPAISSLKRSVVAAILHEFEVPCNKIHETLRISGTTIRKTHKILFTKHKLLEIQDLNSSH